MAIHGKGTVVLINEFDLTTFLDEVSDSLSVEANESTVFASTAKEYVAGLLDATVDMSGFYNVPPALSVDAIEDWFEQVEAATGYALIVPGGLGLGKRAQIAQVIRTGFDITSPVADLVSVDGSLQASGGLQGAVMLTTATPFTATAPGSTVDSGIAALTAGIIAQLHIPTNTRTGTVTVAVQHSTNGSTWADLTTFAVVSAGALKVERKSVTATVNRYLRVNVTLGAGTGSVTIHVAIVRL